MTDRAKAIEAAARDVCIQDLDDDADVAWSVQALREALALPEPTAGEDEVRTLKLTQSQAEALLTCANEGYEDWACDSSRDQRDLPVAERAIGKLRRFIGGGYAQR